MFHFLKKLFSSEGAALEATFKLVNQSKSVMSCNGRHGDKLLVNQSKSVMSSNIHHGDQLCVCVQVDHTDGTQISITHESL